MTRKSTITAISTILLTVACGKGTAQDQAPPEGPAQAFHGIWDGQYQKLDRENGHTLSESVARAEFTVDSETAGTFRMRFPSDENAMAEGTFQVFKSDSLLLKVESSSFSNLGLTGTVTSVDFEIAGNALELKNDRLKLLLLRDPEGEFEDDPDAPNDADDDPGFGSSRWGCKDGTLSSWDLKIEGTAFSATIVSSAGASYESSGTVEQLEIANEALLQITNSTVSANVGRTIKITVDGDSLSASLRKGATEIDAFPCKRR